MVQIEHFKLKAIFFDIDDTLIPTTQHVREVRKQGLDDIIDFMRIDGLKFSKQRVYKTFKQVLEEFGPDHKNHFGTTIERLKFVPPEMRSKYTSAGTLGYRQGKKLRPYPAVTSTLSILRQEGYGLYGVSKGLGVHQWGKIIASTLNLQLNNSFITSDYNFKEKSESFYQKILETLSLEGKYCLMVGDNVDNDVIPARKCGIHTARVLTGKYKKGPGKAEDDADYKIRKFEEVLKIILKIEIKENAKLKSLIDKITK
ncbi:MAG: HAD hydrolase-like protein [Nanoarchaeota archaeon]|nr:HAD hydrolase-like protein [Nanoarchaeota archaeon]